MSGVVYIERCRPPFISAAAPVHRPANILLDSERNVKLGDFGLAVASGRAPARAAVSPLRSRLARAVPPPHEHLAESSISMGVGTVLYRAPEVTRSPGASDDGARYGAPADIFSLGIVLFELFHPPFSTLMERGTCIQRLRECQGRPEGVPPAFLRSAPQAALTLLRAMLSFDPAERPSAADLLRNPLIPHRADIDEDLLLAPNSALYASVLRAAFARPTPDFKDLSFDLVDSHHATVDARNRGLEDWERPDFVDVVTNASDAAFLARLLARVFERSGAVRYDAHDVSPRAAPLSGFSASSLKRQLASALVQSDAAHSDTLATLAEALGLASKAPSDVGGKERVRLLQSSLSHLMSTLPPPALSPLAVALQPPFVSQLTPSTRLAKLTSPLPPSAVQLVDSDGTVILLPFDLCHPFARFLARRPASHIKRHSVAYVYRQREGGGQPRRYAEASFDVVWPASASQPAEELQLSGALDAEVIGASVEALAAAVAFTSGSGRVGGGFFLRISNSKILSGLLEALAIHPAVAGVLCDLMTAVSVANLSAAPTPAAGTAGGASAAASSWGEVRSFLLTKLQLTQSVVDSLRPFLAPSLSWTVPSLCAAVETFVARQRRPVEKRLLPLLLGASVAGAGGSTASEQKAALQQLRGLMLMAQGARELRATYMYLAAAATGSLTDAAEVCAGAFTQASAMPSATPTSAGRVHDAAPPNGGGSAGVSSASRASATPVSRPSATAGGGASPLGTGAKQAHFAISRIGVMEQLLFHSHGHAREHARGGGGRGGANSGLVVDLGLAEPRSYHGLVFQLVLRPLSAAIQGGGGGAPRSAEGRDAGNAAIETLLKLGMAFVQACESDCVARGGRYDETVLRYQPPGASELDQSSPSTQVARTLVAAAQARFGVDKLYKSLRALTAHRHSHSGGGPARLQQRREPGRALPLLPRSDVLVCSIFPVSGDDGGDLSRLDGLLFDRRCLAAELGAAGLAAEYLHPPLGSYDSAAAYAGFLGAKVLCIVRRDAPGAGAARVRVRDIVGGRDDVEVAAVDAASAASRLLHGAALALQSTAAAAMRFAAPEVPISGQLGGVVPPAALHGGSSVPPGGGGGGNAAGAATPGSGAATPSVLSDAPGGAAGGGVVVECHLGLGDDVKHSRAAAVERRALTRLRDSGLLAGFAAAAAASGNKPNLAVSRVTAHLLVIDVPFKAVRDLVTAFSTSDGIDEASSCLFGRLDKDLARYKAALRDALELLFRLSSAPRAGGAEPRIVLYSSADDRFDTVHL